MKIISLSNGHDASITAFENGEILGHWELERVLNIKHFCGVDHGNEIAGVLYDHVLPRLGWEVSDIDAVVFAGKSEWKKTEFHTFVPQYEDHDNKKPWSYGTLELRGEIIRPCYSVVHHVNHMAYAYFTSPYTSSLLFSYDGIGDGTSTMAGKGHHNKLKVTHNFARDLPERNNGIGLCYSYLGRLFPFLGNDLLATAGKAMGLSSYGLPYLDGEVWDICWSMITEWMPEPGKYKARLQELLPEANFNDPMNQECQNVMATIQECLEVYLCSTITYLRTLASLQSDIPLEDGNLCMAGGCALNVQANTRLIDTGTIDNLYVPPATSDCGVSIGAALYVWHHVLDNAFDGVEWHNPYLGDEVYGKPPETRAHLTRDYNASDQARDAYINEMRDRYPELIITPLANMRETTKFAAKQLADRRIIAWAQGRCEIGPRALGNRSILCHPGSDTTDYVGDDKWYRAWRAGGGSMKLVINEAVKHREFWRPFAPIALWPDCQEYFHIDHEQPYMLEAPLAKDFQRKEEGMVYCPPGVINPRWHKIPAVVHVDGTARVQTVTFATNPLMADLLLDFKELTGLPVLLNTSLNDAGIPINNRIEDILNLVRDTEVDYAIVDNWVFFKRE